MIRWSHMRASAVRKGIVVLACVIGALTLYSLLAPIVARGVDMQGDEECQPVIMQCECSMKFDPQAGCVPASKKENMHNCECTDVTNGKPSKGKCTAEHKCRGDSSAGQNGGSQALGDLSQLMQQIQQIMKSLGGGGGGGGGGGQQGGGGGGAGDASLSGRGQNSSNPQVGFCQSYYSVTSPSSDPCAVYKAPVSESLSSADELTQSLASGGGAPRSSATSSASAIDNAENGGGTASSTGETAGAADNGAAGSETTGGKSAGAPFQGGLLALPPGLSGDIRYSNSRVTILASDVDAKSNTQVAGFYGAAADGEPQGVIARMCASRPWTANFLSSIIPSSFFDSLCTLRGYKVGAGKEPAPVGVSRAKSSKPKRHITVAATTTAATSSGPYVPPKVDIWAVPASVALGARTTVFWNAKGVTSCTETSPDGSFSQNTLSGGAATVPLSGPTTYTISCITPAGDHATNYVTVNLSAN